MGSARLFIEGIGTSAFAPRKFAGSAAGRVLLDRWGWTLIAARWCYYSILFTFFRDYSGGWRPFVAPPFGLAVSDYAWIQSRFAWVFGFLLLTAMAVVWSGYLSLVGKRVGVFRLLNVLGPAFFLPFVLLQLVDLLAFPVFGWDMRVTIVTHTSVLVWESVTAVLIVDCMIVLRRRDILVSTVLLMATWIAICATVWR